MNNLRDLALAAGVSVLSAFGFASNAIAQTANVDFAGNIPISCVVNSKTNGSLALANFQNLVAVPNYAGTPGNINVSCNGGTTFTITSVADNGSALSGAGYTSIDKVSAEIRNAAYVAIAYGDTSPNNSAATPNPPNIAGPLQPTPINFIEYKVNLVISNTSAPLPTGTYNVRVSIALTPQ